MLLKRKSDHEVHLKKWGIERWIYNGEPIEGGPEYNLCGKDMFLWKKHECSLHKHEKKFEFFVVVSGRMLMRIETVQGEKLHTVTLEPGDVQFIPVGTWHQFQGLTDCHFMEFSTHHEDEDNYRRTVSGRVKPLGDRDVYPE